MAKCLAYNIYIFEINIRSILILAYMCLTNLSIILLCSGRICCIKKSSWTYKPMSAVRTCSSQVAG